MDNSELDTWFTTRCTSEQTDMKSPVAIIRGLVGEVVNRHRTTNNTLHIFSVDFGSLVNSKLYMNTREAYTRLGYVSVHDKTAAGIG